MIPISKMVMPALIAGLVFGLLSQIPFLNCLNLFCCLLVILGGVLAAYLLERKAGKIEAVDGAAVGITFGFFYSIFATVIGLLITAVFNAIGISLGVLSGAPADLLAESGVAVFAGAIGAFVGFGFYLLFGVVFGAVGGVIWATVRK